MADTGLVEGRASESGQVDLVPTRSREARMDQMPRPAETENIGRGDRTVSRRAFLNRARLGLMAVAGVALFGAATTAGVVAKESSDEDEKEKKEKPRDKDREAKEKEKDAKNKSSGKDNKSNTRKKKNKNGDDSKKKQRQKDPVAESPYRPFVVTGQDKYGCTAFANQHDAQQVLRLEPRDPNGLDGNRNGIACDGSDAFLDGVPGGLMNPPFDLTPVPRP